MLDLQLTEPSITDKRDCSVLGPCTDWKPPSQSTDQFSHSIFTQPLLCRLAGLNLQMFLLVMYVRRTTKDFGCLFGLPQLCQYVPDVVWGPGGISVRRGCKSRFLLFCYHMKAEYCSILWWNNTAVISITILHFIGQSIMALTFPVY